MGRNPELSLMETASFLQSHGFQHKMLSFNEHAALVEVEEKNIQEIQNSLGGIVKIGKVFIECEFKKEFLEKGYRGECGLGWKKLIDPLLVRLAEMDGDVFQIKEKFGGVILG